MAPLTVLAGGLIAWLAEHGPATIDRIARELTETERDHSARGTIHASAATVAADELEHLEREGIVRRLPFYDEDRGRRRELWALADMVTLEDKLRALFQRTPEIEHRATWADVVTRAATERISIELVPNEALADDPPERFIDGVIHVRMQRDGMRFRALVTLRRVEPDLVVHLERGLHAIVTGGADGE